MEPELAKQLMSRPRIMQKFIIFVRGKVAELDSISDIDKKLSKEDIAIEVRARELAYEKLEKILDPLLDVGEERSKFNKNEYNVVVD